MEHTIYNPLVPRASIIRYPNGIFELRLHLHGIASHVEIVPHDNYILVSGRLVPRAKKDCSGRVSTIIWTDAACGHFSRDIQLRLSPGTQILILERRQDCEDYVIRYTLRNTHIPRPTCASLAQFDQYSSRPYCSCGQYPTDICGNNTPNHGPCAKGANCTCGPTHVGGYGHGHPYDSHAGVFTNQGTTTTIASGVPPTVPPSGPHVHNAEGFAVQQI